MLNKTYSAYLDKLSKSKKSEFIENEITKAIDRYNRSNIVETKTQAILDEIFWYYQRNKSYDREICSFEVYVQHWILANSPVIPEIYLEEIRDEYGQLKGPLYILPKTSSWCTKKDWGEDLEQVIKSMEEKKNEIQ